MLKEFGVDEDTTLRAYADAKEAPGVGFWSFAHRLKQLANNIEFGVQENQLVQKFIRGLWNKVVASFVKSKDPRKIERPEKNEKDSRGDERSDDLRKGTKSASRPGRF